VGLFDYFRRRRERECAVAGLELTAEPSRSAAPLTPSEPAAGTEGTETLETAGIDLAQLGQLGRMIAQSAREGTVQVHVGEPQELDLSGGGNLREEIITIMDRHGIDAAADLDSQIDATRLPAMQQEILEAVARQGVDLGAYFGGEPGR